MTHCCGTRGWLVRAQFNKGGECMKHSGVTFNLLVCCVLLVFGSAGLQAQTIYRIVGPDGRVTFSDKAPLDVDKATATNANGKPVASSDSGLPYELRQIVSRYPVTLYTGVACTPCNSGRLLLQSRGIPFTENTISTPEDAEALQRISGDNSLPLLTVGGQKIKGFSETEWIQFLDAAKYPATSLLPANYRHPQPRPLVTAQKPAQQNPAEAKASNEEKPAAREPSTPPTNTSNPVGIKF